MVVYWVVSSFQSERASREVKNWLEDVSGINV